MKVQYLLILSLFLAILGSALSSKSGTAPEEIMKQSESDFLLQEVNYIASGAVIYWRKPVAMGGGKRSFGAVTDVSAFGVEPVNANRIHQISRVTKKAFRLTSIGLLTGVKVTSIITGNGLDGNPVIEVPLLQ